MLLSAGLGARLRPLTSVDPKPALTLLHRPIVAYAMDALAQAGVRHLLVNAFHLAERLEEVVRAHVPRAVTVEVVRETTLLGTGGGIRNLWGALPDPEEPVLICNADTLFVPDFGGALEHHRRLDAIATMVVRPDPRAQVYGAIEHDSMGRVRRLLGTPEHRGRLSVAMYTGAQILAPRAIRELPTEGCIIRQSYRRWVDVGLRVGAFVDRSPWMDLGTPATLHRANLLLGYQSELRDRFGVSDTHPIHVEAEVDRRAHLHECVVGPGARVGAVHLQHCVVLPGATVQSDDANALIAPGVRWEAEPIRPRSPWRG